jgi:hypothetical protein
VARRLFEHGRHDSPVGLSNTARPKSLLAWSDKVALMTIE